MSDFRAAARTPEAHQPLPANTDAEQGVLSSLLLAPTQIGELCIQRGVTQEYFHIPQHAMIYTEIQAMLAEPRTVDLITLTEWLRSRKMLELVGGSAQVATLFTLLPTAANAVQYIEILKEKRTLRQGIKICMEGARKCFEEQENVAAVIEEIRIQAVELANGSQHVTGCPSFATERAKEAVKQRIGNMLMGQHIGVATGLKTWDTQIGPIIPGMHVIAARQKVGKTALIEGLMCHQTRALKRAVILFEKDMSADDVLNRMACRDANVIYEDFTLGYCNEFQVKAVRRKIDEIDSELLRIYTPSNFTTREIRETISKEMKERDICAVYIDTFGKIRYGGTNLNEGLTRNSIDLNEIQKEARVPFVILDHINREGGKAPRPTKDQLKGCDQLLSDCDTLSLLWSEEDPKDCYTVDTKTGKKSATRQKVWLTRDANRGGSVGDFPLYFDRPMMRFFSDESRAGETGAR